MRVGEGTYVSDEPSKFLDRVFTQGLINTERDLDALWHTRILLEKETTALCAEHFSDESLRTLNSLLAGMQESKDRSWEIFLRLDAEFHQSIANYSQNAILAELLRTVRGLLSGMFAGTTQNQSAMELAFAQHVEILEKLKQRDPHAAKRAMGSHLAGFREAYKILLLGSETTLKTGERSGPLVE